MEVNQISDKIFLNSYGTFVSFSSAIMIVSWSIDCQTKTHQEDMLKFVRMQIRWIHKQVTKPHHLTPYTIYEHIAVSNFSQVNQNEMHIRISRSI